MKLQDIVKKSEQSLKENQENWSSLWNGWADGLLKNEKDITNARKQYHEWHPLRIYMPIGEAKKSKTQCRFAIRYYGKDIAEIETKFKDMVPYLIFDDVKTKNNHRRSNRNSLGLDMLDEKFRHPWDSKPSEKFRTILKNLELPARDEHMLESMVLDEMGKKVNDKFEGTLKNIQPVQLYGKLRFQMKIPFSANEGVPNYSKNCGGIDILARIGSGHNTNLAVLELKREDKNSYKKAIAQSIIYSIGLIYLLRDETMGPKWWKLFGFKRALPQSISIYAAATIPYSIRDEFKKERKDLNITDDTVINIGQDKIKLGHIFFDQTKNNRIDIKGVGGIDNIIFDNK
ncbi:hypothetical protein KAJ27_14080 [bacterium]|nr:hypothetical protein [bacterium]